MRTQQQKIKLSILFYDAKNKIIMFCLLSLQLGLSTPNIDLLARSLVRLVIRQ